MKPQVIYVRRYIPKPVRVLFWVLFLGIAIESLFFTVPTLYHVYISSRKPHVHTNSRPHAH